MIEIKDNAKLPLCVDLDGTLIKSDLLTEAFLVLCKQNFLASLALLLQLFIKGRLHFKLELSKRVSFEQRSLPFNDQLIDGLKKQQQNGRELILVSASPLAWVEQAASQARSRGVHFSNCYGSAGSVNLKSHNKAQLLSEKYSQGFTYIGNSSDDLAVWSKAQESYACLVSKSLADRIISQRLNVLILSKSRINPKLILKTFRVHQWSKNLLIFIPLFLSHQFNQVNLIINSLVTFFSFSFLASSIYILNDLFDLDSDRKHHSKRNRPIPSGSISIPLSILCMLSLFTCGVLLCLYLPLGYTLVAALYLVLTTLYTFKLKELLTFDVITLAVLYTTRIIAGYSVTFVDWSSWLLTFSFFFFLSLAFTKRYSELFNLKKQNKETSQGRAYTIADLPVVLAAGIGSSLLSVLILSLYMSSPDVSRLYKHPLVLIVILPLMVTWLLRIWILTGRGQMNEDPVSFAVKDKFSYLMGFLILIILMIATA